MPQDRTREGRDRRVARAAVGSLVLAFLSLIAVSAMLVPGRLSLAAPKSGNSSGPGYVSATVCAECHMDAYNAWQDSHHSWALREPTPKTVLGDFDDAAYEHRGVRSRFFKRDDKFIIETDGPDGKLAEFEIKYTVGVAPLQQYLVELDRGRLQALDIAWDTEGKRWFHLYPGQKLEFGDGLHWSGPYKNWQARCAECHQTNFTKGYSPKTRSYQSRWSELTVACEACHGPGSAHVAWARDPARFPTKQLEGVDAKGLTVAFAGENPETEIQLCASCHSRRSTLGADSPPPGSKFADHYRLALLRDGLYHADGQIDDEVYVYGSFLQSKMYARGVRCSNCHEPHSGALAADGNAVCTQCHSPAGNSDFPSLRKTTYDDPSHHHHEAGSNGAQCVNCHMPSKTYMRVDPRRDHSFRVPRPDLTETIGTPNACTGCHQGKTAKWASAKLKEWFPDGRTGTPHYGEILHAGRTETSVETGQKLLALALDTAQPPIVRATALDLIGRSIEPALLESVVPLLKDDADLVRAAALRLIGQGPADLKIRSAASLFDDPVQAVRLEAARLAIAIPPGRLSKTDLPKARKVVTDYQRSLFSRADYPGTQMQIAGLAMALRNFDAAQSALGEALSMDPELPDAWLMLARIQSALQKPDEARRTLERAAKELPDNGQVLLQLGSHYSARREHGQAVQALEKTRKLSGATPELLELLAINYLALNDIEKARTHALELVRLYPLHQPDPILRRLLK
jgi:predicted CXXCH cytochrome family protein